MAKPPIITLLTDFGLTDHYVAAMKGVILGICPEVQLVDISHEIRPFQIGQAAFALGQAYVCFPRGTVHVVVVDPGVGSARRPLLVEADGQYFVGPDNGVLSIPMEGDARHKAREITASRYFRKPVSNTFHGRDIFAPVAARVALGTDSSKMGTQISDPVRLDFASPIRLGEGYWTGRILYVDRFGNLVTNFRVADIPEITFRPFKMQIQATSVSQYYYVYQVASADLPIAIPGSSGYIEISVNKGNAARATGGEAGSAVTLRLG
jgi:S-adenosyl-L-methionine hydrolase (adenosine-forming)